MMRAPLEVLNVAEKPSVAKEITRLLSNNEHIDRRRSHSQYNPVTAFPYRLLNTTCTMVVTSVRGHLMSIDFPKECRDWNAVAPESLYSVPLERFVSDSSKDISKNLTDQSKKCGWIVLWLDCDREGEAIAFEVLEVCLKANPRLQVHRAIFSALTKRDIERACATLQQPQKFLSDAVETRSEIDLRIGASFTRFMTLRFQRRLELPPGLISYGPCQFPTLGFVVERFLEIERFVAESFWSIKVVVEKESIDHPREKCRVEFLWDRQRLFDRLAVFILFELCLESPEALVVNVKGRATTKLRPLPLTTVEMNKAASRKLHMSSQKCMQVAEALYNKGFISYPRTETDTFPDSMDLMGIISQHIDNPVWGLYARGLVNEGKFQWPRSGKHNDEAHPPIYVVKSVGRQECEGEDEWRLYEYVSRYFLACCSHDARGFETTVELEVAGEGFHAHGLIVKEKNWLDVFPYESWTGTKLPHFSLYERFIPEAIMMTEGKTEPPSLLSEADLIDKMDKNGIGTDATMHEHIQTIQDRHYSYKNENLLFVPSVLGVALVKGYNAFASEGIDLSKPELRALMEADMADIAVGRQTKPQVLSKHLTEMCRIFKLVREKVNLLDVELARHFPPVGSSVAIEGHILTENFSKCGRCSGMMDLKSSGGGGGGGRGGGGRGGGRRRTTATSSSSSSVASPVRRRANATTTTRGGRRATRGRGSRGGGGRGGRQPSAAAVTSVQENRFLVCRNYASGQCRTVLHLPTRGEVSAVQHTCPICNFQVVSLLNLQTQRSHTACPFCFRNPPLNLIHRQHQESRDNDGVRGAGFGDFRCFMCMHPTCRLAIGRNN